MIKLLLGGCVLASGCCGSGSWFNAASALYREVDSQPIVDRTTEYDQLIKRLGKPDLILTARQLEAKLGTQPMATYGNYRAYVLAQMDEAVTGSSGSGAGVVYTFSDAECLIYQGQARYLFPAHCDGNFTAFIFVKRGNRIIGCAFINPWFAIS